MLVFIEGLVKKKKAMNLFMSSVSDTPNVSLPPKHHFSRKRSKKKLGKMLKYNMTLLLVRGSPGTQNKRINFNFFF